MKSKLALDGGEPYRNELLPYGRQTIDEGDVGAVIEALQSDYLTTGPRVAAFERQFAVAVGARQAVALSSGTAALHASVAALGIGDGDEVIVPSMTFSATAGCVVLEGATPVFADVQADTLLIDPASIEERLTAKTKAVIAVDYAGQACDYDAIRELLAGRGVPLIADACHSLGGAYKGRPVGTIADMTAFSLHPVKAITGGEGGVVTTDDEALADRMRRFRNHGIDVDHRERLDRGAWFYEIVELGCNYRLTDIQCALASSQLKRLKEWTRRRRQLAARYDDGLSGNGFFRPLGREAHNQHAYHLYVVRVDPRTLGADRDTVFRALRAEGIGVNVHYIPVHLHPFYRRRFKTEEGLCPVAEEAFQIILTLPLFPSMADNDIADVLGALEKVSNAYRRQKGTRSWQVAKAAV